MLLKWSFGTSHFFIAILAVSPAFFLARFLPFSSPAQASLSRPRSSHREFAVRQMWGLEHYEAWPNYFDELDHSRLAPLTAEAQRWIYDKFHPPVETCSSQKYFVLGSHQGGLGSVIHVTTWRLAVALEHGYQPVWHPNWIGAGSWYADPGCGRNDTHTNFLCFFESPSTCGYEYVTADNSLAPASLRDVPFGLDSTFVPTYLRDRFVEAFPHFKFSVHVIKFWWRAQGAAYLMRLNAPTRKVLIDMRLDKQMHQGFIVPKHGSPIPVEVPFPFPLGTTNVHVRHGDKAIEMTLVPFKTYVEKVENFTAENPLAYTKTIFVSSEDPSVIDEAIELKSSLPLPEDNWVVYFSKIHRINGGPHVMLKAFGKTVMTYEWLLQLLMALECDSFVGTLGSNWNRLIAELRCVWIDSCYGPYFEVGPRKDWGGYRS